MDNTSATFISPTSTSVDVQVGSNGNPGSTAIELYYAKGDSNGPTEAFTSAGSKTSGYLWNMTGLDEGTDYWFKAAAKNWVNIWSSNCSVTTFVTLGPPANFRCIDCATDSLTWAWDPKGGDGFTIFDNDSGTAIIDEIYLQVTNTVETGLSPNTSYRRHIKAYDWAGTTSENCSALYSCTSYGTTESNKTVSDWQVGDWFFNPCTMGGFVKFDLSSYSQPKNIRNVRLFAYCWDPVSGVNIDFRKVTIDPEPATWDQLTTEIEGPGTFLYNGSTIAYSSGYKVQDLWDVANPWVEEAILGGTGCCSIAGTNFIITNAFIAFYGYDYATVDMRPFLEVTYGSGAKNYTNPSPMVEACTLAVVPTMDNTSLTFTAQTGSSITAQVGLGTNPPGTSIELFYAAGDQNGPTAAFSSAGIKNSPYSWNVTGLASDTSYWFQAHAINWSGIATANCSITVWSTDVSVGPQVPTNFSCTDCSSTTLTWAWDDTSNEDGYQILDDVAGTIAVDNIAQDDVTTVETGLTPNTTYSRKIRSYWNAGPTYSGNSSVVDVCTLAAVPAMTNTAVTFTFANEDTITAVVGDGGNPPGTTIDLEYALGDANGPTVAFASATPKTSGYTWTIPGLTINTSYWFRARAQNWGGIWANYCDVTVWSTVANMQPGNFRVTDCSSTTITWAWNDVPGESGYQILDNATGAIMVDNIPINTTTTEETGLSPNVTYYRQVRSFILLGPVYSDNSNMVAACTLADVPTMDNTSLTFTAQTQVSINASVGLSLNPAGTTVELFYAEGDANGPTSAYTSAGTKVSGYLWNVTGLTADTSYWFIARAQNYAGFLTGNSAVTVWSTETFPAPTGFIATGCSTSSITWTWVDTSGAEDGFQLMADGGAVIITTGPDVEQTVETGLAENTQYTRLVRAYAGANYSGNSNTASAYTLCSAPGAGDITFTGITESSMNVNLTECPNAGAGSTAAEFVETSGETGSDDSGFITDRDGGKFFHYDDGLKENTSYYWKARYRNGAGIPTAFTSSIPQCTLLADPLDSEVTFWNVTYNSIEIRVATPPASALGITGAQFFETTGNPGGSGRPMQCASYTYININLDQNQKYAYQARYQNQIGITTNSNPNPQEVYTLLLPPSTAPNINATETTVGLSVALPLPPNSTLGNTGAYFVYTGGFDGHDSFMLVGQYSYIDTGLTPNTLYEYVVYFQNADNQTTADSPSSSIYTLANIPGKPDFGSVFPDSVAVSWSTNSNPGNTTYYVQRSENGGGWTQVYNGVTSNFVDSTGITALTTYTYQVRAQNRDGVSTGWSENATTMTPNQAGPSSFWPGPVTTNTIRWNWTDDITGESKFEIRHRVTDAIIIPDIPPGTTNELETGLWPNEFADRKIIAIVGGTPTGPTANSTYTLLPDPTVNDLTITPNSAYELFLSVPEPLNGNQGFTASYIEFLSGGAGGDTSGWLSWQYTHTDSGLEPNATYTYRFRYRNGNAVWTNWSGAKSAATLGTVPGQPTFTNIAGTSVTVNWNDNANPAWTIFEIQRANGGSFTSITNTSGTTYDDSGLAGVTTYTYRIRSINLDGLPSVWSENASFKTYPSSKPVVTLISGPVLVYGPAASPGLEFQCDQSIDYVVQLGGDGTLGSGTTLDSGNCTAGVPVGPIVFNRADLDPDNAALTVYVTCYVAPDFLDCASCTVYDDHMPPTSNVTNPTDGQWLASVTAISGTALDTGGANVGLVELVLLDETNGWYYNNASNAFDTSVPLLFAVTNSSESWSTNTALIVFDDTHTYKVASIATDTVGNVGPFSANTSFTIDTTLPDLTINSPPDTPSPVIIGPTVDADVQFQVNEDSDYFLRLGGDGSIGSGVDVGSGVVLADTPRDVSVPATSFADDAVERLHVIIRAHSNLAIVFKYRDFHDDQTIPSTSVSTTLSGTMDPPQLISGSSSDDMAGLATVEIAIRDSSGLYFVPVSGQFEPGTTWILATGLISWSYDAKDVRWKNGMDYTISIRVTDLVGNIETRDVGMFTATVKPTGGGFGFGGGGGGGGCFLATACYESSIPFPGSHVVTNATGTYYISPESNRKLETLRAFRDGVLSQYRLGREFTKWYYRISPSLASTIRSRPAAKTFTRWLVVTPAYLLAREALGYSYFLRILSFIVLMAALIIIRGRSPRKGAPRQASR